MSIRKREEETGRMRKNCRNGIIGYVCVNVRDMETMIDREREERIASKKATE